MADKELMNWQGDRWEKRLNGERKLVGPRTLKKEFPDLFRSNSRAGSREAANAWWERISSSTPPQVIRQIPMDEEDGMRLTQIIDRANFFTMEADAKRLLCERVGIDPNFLDQRRAGIEALLADDETILNHATSTLIQKYLDVKKTKIVVGQMQIGSWDQIRMQLARFQEFFGADADCTTINEDTIQRFFTWLAEKTQGKNRALGAVYADTVFKTTRQFIKFLWANRICELPRNLTSADLRFRKAKKTIRTFSTEDIANFFGNAADRPKLYGLLTLNCGFLNIDIAHLTTSAVDWKKGTITWKRHKEEHTDSVPTTTYRLWPETLRLLKQEHAESIEFRKRWKTADDGLLLLTMDGAKLQRTTIKRINGVEKMAKTDAIKSAMKRAFGEIKLKKNPRQLRATSSTMLENHEVFCRYEQHFLGHAPTSIAGKHYVTPSQEQFDKALAWLGQQFGF